MKTCFQPFTADRLQKLSVNFQPPTTKYSIDLIFVNMACMYTVCFRESILSMGFTDHSSDVQVFNLRNRPLVTVVVDPDVIIFADIDRHGFPGTELHRHHLVPGPLPVVGAIVFELTPTKSEVAAAAARLIGDGDTDRTGSFVGDKNHCI
jgi:hypothetical protein